MDTMNLSEAVRQYYAMESLSGFIVCGSGLLLSILAALLLKYASPQQYTKGFFITLLIGGVFFIIGGGISGYATKKSAGPKYQAYQDSSDRFAELEIKKAEQIHKSWTIIFISWIAVLLAGLLLTALKKGYWAGFGSGLLLIAVLGHIEEVISFKRNENYRNQVLEYNHISKATGNQHISPQF